MSTPAFRHWSRQSVGRLWGGSLIAMGLAVLLAALILGGNVGGRRLLLGSIPIGLGSVMLAYCEWSDRQFRKAMANGPGQRSRSHARVLPPVLPEPGAEPDKR